MGYYAAYLDVTDRTCVVVGGSGPAAEKVRGLLESGARVVVCADDISEDVSRLESGGRVEVRRRGFEESDLEGCLLVIDASGDDASGARVAAAARARGVLVNVLDRPALCDFIAPALLRRGPLQVAISTAGRSPFMASHLRKRLEDDYGPEWGELVEMVGQLRDRLRASGVPLEQQNQVYARIPDSGALELLREGRPEAARLALLACAPDQEG
jgi:precorrin-2 dehydrogenase/sirohydrochlorin ferrochelatase